MTPSKHYSIVWTFGETWELHPGIEGFNSAVDAADFVLDCNKLYRRFVPEFRCYYILPQYVAELVGKSAQEPQGVIVYGGHNTFIV